MPRNRLVYIFLSLALIVSLIAGCNSTTSQTTTAQKNKEVTFGAVLCTSGPAASLGQPVLDGVQYAIKKINDAGGITVNGEKYTIKLVNYDDKGDANSTVSAVQRLIENDKASVIIGPITSTSTLAAMEITEKAKIPMITPIAASPAITSKGYKYIFRDKDTASEQTEGVISYATQVLKLKKGAIMARNDDWGRSSVEEFKKRLESKGGQVVATEYHEPSDKDFSAQLSKIKAANPDFVYLVVLAEDGVPAIKQYRELGIKSTLFVPESITDIQVKTLGKDAEGLIMPKSDAGETPEMRAFYDDIKKVMNRQKDDPSFVGGSDTVNLLVKAFEKAGTINDGTKLREAMLQTQYKGLKTTYSFGENGQAKLSMYITKIASGGKREWIGHK